MVMTRMGLPDAALFRWKSPDGSSVLLRNTIKGYGWGVGLGLYRDLDVARFTKITSDLRAVQATTKAPVYLGWGTDLFAPKRKTDRKRAAAEPAACTRSFSVLDRRRIFSRSGECTPLFPRSPVRSLFSWANVISSMSHLWCMSP